MMAWMPWPFAAIANEAAMPHRDAASQRDERAMMMAALMLFFLLYARETVSILLSFGNSALISFSEPA